MKNIINYYYYHLLDLMFNIVNQYVAVSSYLTLFITVLLAFFLPLKQLVSFVRNKFLAQK